MLSKSSKCPHNGMMCIRYIFFNNIQMNICLIKYNRLEKYSQWVINSSQNTSPKSQFFYFTSHFYIILLAFILHYTIGIYVFILHIGIYKASIVSAQACSLARKWTLLNGSNSSSPVVNCFAFQTSLIQFSYSWQKKISEFTIIY